jgi:hypothetical protein
VFSGGGGASTARVAAQLDRTSACLALGYATSKNEQSSVLTLGEREWRARPWSTPKPVRLVVISGTRSVQCADAWL